MALGLIPDCIREKYLVQERKHAISILATDFPEEFKDILSILSDFWVRPAHFTERGGGKSKVGQDIDARFTKLGWVEKQWDTKIVVDGEATESPTHKVDCFKNRIALELEWNNKDPFYDRDLNNFRLLFDLRVISAGVIITKADDLKSLLEAFPKEVQAKYGASTTWMSKLMPRIEGGGGGGCSLLVFGITKACYKP